MPSDPPFPATRVVKRIAPHQPGALRHARRFGARLVCVRYRHDLAAQRRYTTVELVVDEAPIRDPRSADRQATQIVTLRLAAGEASLRQSLIAHGALWDAKSHLWYAPRNVAHALGLSSRIV